MFFYSQQHSLQFHTYSTQRTSFLFKLNELSFSYNLIISDEKNYNFSWHLLKPVPELSVMWGFCEWTWSQSDQDKNQGLQPSNGTQRLFLFYIFSQISIESNDIQWLTYLQPSGPHCAAAFIKLHCSKPFFKTHGWSLEASLHYFLLFERRKRFKERRLRLFCVALQSV